jgi:hypothetical protein
MAATTTIASRRPTSLDDCYGKQVTITSSFFLTGTTQCKRLASRRHLSRKRSLHLHRESRPRPYRSLRPRQPDVPGQLLSAGLSWHLSWRSLPSPVT